MEKKKIFIVDDEQDFTAIMKFTLEATGKYIVSVENKGDAAIEGIRSFAPDLILLDVLMPGMDGSDIATQLKEDASVKNTPIIFLTSLVSRKETETGISLQGRFPFISKALDLKDLISNIEKYIK